MGRPTYEAPTREYTHKHTQTQTNTQRGPTKYGVDSRRGGAPSLSEEGASPPPPASCISVAISHAEAMCTATERRCACSANHVDVDQLTSFSYCRFVSLFRTLSCIRLGRAAPPARSSRRRSRRAASASPCPSATARGRSPASCTRRSRRRCGAKSCQYHGTPGGNSALDAALREAKDVRPRAGRGVAEADEGTTPPDVLHPSPSPPNSRAGY
jgi:hypothetical protein